VSLFQESQRVLAAAGREEGKVEVEARLRRQALEDEEFLWALQAARTNGGHEFALADRSHWLWGSLDPAQGEVVFWVRRKDPSLQTSHRVSHETVFPHEPGDVLQFFDAETLHEAGRARVERVAVRPQQGGDGAAATGYVTATLLPG